MNLALNNVYCANTHPPSVILGLAHGSYGIGGIVAPIAGTALVSSGVLWSRFYFLAVGLRICCIVFAGFAFWSYAEDSEPTLLTALEATSSRQTAAEGAASKFNELKIALKNKVTIFGALFIFAYQGAEVSISGWIISYLIKYRDGDPAKVGYVTAGFWVRLCKSSHEMLLTLFRAASPSAASSSHTLRPCLEKRNSSSYSPSEHSHCNFSLGSFPTSLAMLLRYVSWVSYSGLYTLARKQSSRASCPEIFRRLPLASLAAQEALEAPSLLLQRVSLPKPPVHGCSIRSVWACMRQ
jgi:hypothetical protein